MHKDHTHTHDVKHIVAKVWSKILREHPKARDEGLCEQLVAHLLFGTEDRGLVLRVLRAELQKADQPEEGTSEWRGGGSRSLEPRTREGCHGRRALAHAGIQQHTPRIFSLRSTVAALASVAPSCQRHGGGTLDAKWHALPQGLSTDLNGGSSVASEAGVPSLNTRETASVVGEIGRPKYLPGPSASFQTARSRRGANIAAPRRDLPRSRSRRKIPFSRGKKTVVVTRIVT